MLNQSYILSILYIDVGLKGHSFYCYILDNYLGHVKALVQWNAHNCGIKTGYELQRIRSLKKKTSLILAKQQQRGAVYDVELLLLLSQLSLLHNIHSSFHLSVCLRWFFLFCCVGFFTNCIKVTICFSHKRVYKAILVSSTDNANNILLIISGFYQNLIHITQVPSLFILAKTKYVISHSKCNLKRG